MKTNLFFLFFVFCSLFFVRQTQAAVTYPIPELGSCRDLKECNLYCDIPANTPACWSYDKYVINKNILGEETVNVTYPISELGSCTSAGECFIFCNQPQNQKTCYDFAKSRGLIREKPKMENIIELAKKELGCTNDLECMVFCQQPDNMDVCSSFARKYRLVKETSGGEDKRPPPAVLQKAKKVLGCNSENSCMNFCNKPENREICFEFAKENDLLSEEEIKMKEEFDKKEKGLLEDSKKELGCDSPETCMPVCEKPENRIKCDTLARKHGMGPPQPQQGQLSQSGQQPPYQPNQPGQPQQFLPGPGGCANEKECKEYCEKNPADCKGFTHDNARNLPPPQPSGKPISNNQPNVPVNKPLPNSGGINNTKDGTFLGPAGCKTEKECKAYCEKHPDDCPAFPNPQKKDNKLTPPPTSSSSENNKRTQDAKKQQVKPASANIFTPQLPNGNPPNQNGSRPPDMNDDNPPPPLLTLPPLEP